MQFDFHQQPGLTRWFSSPEEPVEPLISIITPFYNSAAHIHQTCNSVLNQTFPWFEWIIVDDGSTDPAAQELLQELSCLDSRIRVLSQENAGPSAARNFGVRSAQAELFVPLDSDDLLEPTFLEYTWWMLQKNPGAAWAYADSLGFAGEEYLWTVPFDPIRLKKENHLAITALIRKDAFLSVDGYSQTHKYFNEDWHLWLKLVAAGHYPAQSQGEYLFWYRRSQTGVQSTIEASPEITRENEKTIAEAAAQVQQPHPPVLYPKPFFHNWTRPKCSQWDKTVGKNDKTNILFLLPHLEMGGADKFNLDLIAGLSPEQYRCGIITTIQNTHSWLQRFRQVTPEVFNLANFSDPADYAEFISYYLKSRQVDILFLSNSYHGYALAPWLRQHFPDLVILDYVHMEEWYWRNGGYARTSGMMTAALEKTYVCNSATREVMLDVYGRDPDTVETVHIGVEEGYFDRNLVPAGALYRELGIPETRPIILFICRLHPQKRPFLMLEIAKRVQSRCPDAAFAVVGDGPQEQELRHKAKDLGLSGTVYFLGARKDVRPYYRDARVTLVCSLKEGLSLTAYESCAMGVPVVSADVGGQKDLIDDSVGAIIPCLQSEAEALDGRSFPEEEIQAYVDAISQLLSHEELWQQKASACRRRIENGFTIDNMTDRFRREFAFFLADEASKQRRREAAQALARTAPMAEELFIMEMQMQSAEDYAAVCIENNPVTKIRRTLKEEGVFSLIKKVLRKLKRILLQKIRG